MICTMGINLFRIIMLFLKPILPILSKKTELFLVSNLVWNDLNTPLLSHRIKDFPRLYERLSYDKISKLLKLSTK